jgi:hypothetical protein
MPGKGASSFDAEPGRNARDEDPFAAQIDAG